MSDLISPLSSLAGSLIGGIGGLIAGRRQTKRNMADLNQLGTYKANPLASKQLAFANNLYNSRMPGASYAEQSIMGNQANAMAGVGRNATDASQALAALAGISGQSNNAFADLAQREAMDRMQRAGMVMQAQNTMINEGDKEWQDKLRMLQYKMGIRGVGAENTANSLNSIGSGLAFMGGLWGSGQQRQKEMAAKKNFVGNTIPLLFNQ